MLQVKERLRRQNTFGCQPDFIFLVIVVIILFFFQGSNESIQNGIEVRLNPRGTRDNQRRLCAVQKDGVNLVYDDIVERTKVLTILILC